MLVDLLQNSDTCSLAISMVLHLGLLSKTITIDRVLMVRKQRFNICQNLQFTSTKWAKAYLINYILDKLQESMDNMFILCSFAWIK
jgi:hypothetical protein